MKLIDSNALKNKIMETYLPADRLSAGILFDLLSTARPIDAVPVVRCMECKMYSDNLHDNNLRNGFCTRIKNFCFMALASQVGGEQK